MSERDLVEAIGRQYTSLAALSRWESGERDPLYENRRRLVAALALPYHRIFVPEDVASHLPREARRLFLTAHYLPGSAPNLYVEVEGKGPDRAHALTLASLCLVDDTGFDPKRRRRLWHVTGPGEETLGVLRDE